jgi:putative transposase
LWQRRFWEHTIRDEKDFERHVDYIHFNPVKHELVARVCDWPYSSFHRYVRLGVLPKDWAGDFGQVRIGFGEPRG